MEMDLQKETNDAPRLGELSIDQLPIEIQLMIFRNLRFKHLLKASAVCHRWNELVFFLLQNRISLEFKLDAFWNTERWTPNRIYRKVTSRTDYVGKDFDNSWYRSMAENVRELKCFFAEAHDGGLLQFLDPFEAVETLEVKIGRLQVGKTQKSFVRCAQRVLPSIRHLDLRCDYVRMVDFLAQVAPRLVSLQLELLPRLLPKLMECEFPLLESLKLQLNYGPRVNIPAAAVTKFQSAVRSLRKLILNVDEEYSVFALAFGMPSVEDLSLRGYLRYDHPTTILNGISRLTNLRSLRLNLEACYYISFEHPLPTVESLTINGSRIIHFDTLTIIFPNLKVLSRKYNCLTDYEARQYVSTWRNTLEDLSVRINPASSQVISHLCGLKRLRKISFTFTVDTAREIHQDNIAAFSAITSLDTLQEIHISHMSGPALAATIKELSRFKGTRAIFIDEMPIESLMSFRTVW